MELVLPSRGSRQPEQLSGSLPSEDREVLPLIKPPFSPMISQGCLGTGCRSIAVSADVGSFGSPELGVRAGGGQIRHLLLGPIGTSCLFAPKAETGALKLLVA